MGIVRTPDQTLRQYITAKRPIIYINHFGFEAVDRIIKNAAGAFAKRGFKIIEFTESDGWIDFDTKTLSGKYLNVPTREEIPENINEQLIVDLYSK